MKKRKNERNGKRNIGTSVVIMFLILSLLPMLSPVSATTTTVSIEDVTVSSTGESVTVSLMITDVMNVGVAAIQLSYDPSVVHVTAVTDSEFDVCDPTINNVTGEFEIPGVQMMSDGLSGNVRLANVTLKAVGSAGQSSPLNLVINELVTAEASPQDILADVDNGTFIIEGGAGKHDINVSTDYTGAVDGIKITRDGTDIVGADDNLSIGETYKVRYKLVNEGDFNESVSVKVSVTNATGWNETIETHTYSVNIGDSKTYSDSWDTSGLTEGTYTLKVNASIPVDNNHGNNERTRDIILATGPVQKAPATNVTVPPDTTPIPSGTELPGTTNTEVKLSFRRTDNSGGCGIDYTNYSKTSETGPWTTVNATTATGPDEANVSSITEETFNLTVSDEGDTKIYYYSVDKNANVEATKDLTVRIQSFELQYAKMPAGTTYKCNITNDWNPTNVGQDATMVFFGETAEIDGETYDVSTITKPNGSTKMYTAADATTKNFTMKRLVTEGKLEGQEEVEVNLTFDPAYVLYAYPLKLGKTWTTETNVTGTVIIAGNEITNSTTAVITGTVTEEVDLTVPYGTFHCLVVEITANLSDLPISVKSTYWMNYTDMPIIPKYASSVSGSDAISIELAEELELKEIRGAGANIVYSALEVTPTSGIAPLEITASAKVENTGDFAGNYNASFMIDDMIKGWSNGTLDAGADTTVSFDYNLTEVGTHNVAIADLTAIEVEVTSPGANIVYSALNVTPTSGVAPLNITASAKVENTGDVAGNYNASFMIDDVILDWSNGTLNAGENTTVSFDYNLTEVGTYNVSIADLDAVAVKVTPIIEYSALDVTPTSGDAPLTITASAKVENKGNATRDYNASFKIDGVIEEWRNGTLNAGENTTISFSHTFPTEGTYEVAIDDLAKTITVTKKEEKHKRGGGGGGGGPSDTDGDGYSDIEEIIMGTDPLEPCDPNPNCVACTALTEEEEITPKPTEKPTATPKPKPKPSVTPTTPAPEEPEETPKPTPGFAAVFAIAGLLAVAYLIQRRKK